MNITTLGIDLAQSVLRLHGSTHEARWGSADNSRASSCYCSWRAFTRFDRYGSSRWRSLLGARERTAGPYRSD
jgi:hypothetical protein